MAVTYYTVDRIAAMLDLHPKTVQRYIREGRLKAQKVGKSWRVNGHDLSQFLEGSPAVESAAAPASGLQSVLERAADGIKVSAVVDVPVRNSSDAIQIVNWAHAVIHSRDPEQGPASLSSQYIESEHTLRLLLWGSPGFMETFLGALHESVGSEVAEP